MLSLDDGEGRTGMTGLRQQLAIRQARRYRRRRWRRWRRRRLMMRLLVAEREVAEAPTDALAALHEDERRRLEERLLRDAARLLR